MPKPNYYATLNIDDNATDKEIKKAYWRLAMKYHPDKNPGKEKKSAVKFRKILKAYEVLSNQESRERYDKLYRKPFTKRKDSRRENLRKKAREDVRYLCKLILFELLHQNPLAALEMYENLILNNPGIDMKKYMTDADVRDCEFLLAEAYHKHGKLSKAEKLYERVMERENKKVYFKRFAQEIKDRLKKIYLINISKAKNSEDIENYIKKLLSLDFPKREMASIYKKAAEAYYRIDDIHKATISLRQAFDLNPKLTGAKKISRKLGITSSYIKN
ncbi:DnaJ domain-containing protein [Candidatus Poribacteria bacterium]|nr:DnaJ domain-containing protein [Candidatus Poribacteria bacterium]